MLRRVCAPSAVAALYRYSAATSARCIRRSSSSVGAVPPAAAPASKRRLWLRVAGGTAVLLLVAAPAAKVSLAILPLLGDADKDAASIARLTDSVGLTGARRPSTGLAFLLSEASDRLIRDVYTASVIVAHYVRAPAGQTDYSAIHQFGADRLLKLCEVNRGIYIKLGQHVGQLEYLLPLEYVRTLKLLTHAAPRDSWETVCAVWAAEFPHTPMGDVFESIDPVPIASASLAQVHVGVLRRGVCGAPLDGPPVRVAVKVQHDGLRELSGADIATVSALVRLVKAAYPKVDYEWLADEVRENLPCELDFEREASNCEAAGAAFRHRPDVVVPTVHRALSSSRVLTMSFEDGVYADRVDAIRAMGLRPRDVAALVSEAFCEQVFVQGRAHCDPHAANMLIRRMPDPAVPLSWLSPAAWLRRLRPAPLPRPQLVLLDHGLYRAIPTPLRLDYCKLWRSILRGDERGIRHYSERMGAGDMYQLWASMLTTRSWDKIMDAGSDIETLRVKGTDAERAETHGYARQYAAEISDVLRRIPRELLLILKLNDCLRSVDLALGAPVNTLVIQARYTQRALAVEALARRPGVWTWLRTVADAAGLEAKIQLLAVAQATLHIVSRVTAAGVGGGGA